MVRGGYVRRCGRIGLGPSPFCGIRLNGLGTVWYTCMHMLIVVGAGIWWSWD